MTEAPKNSSTTETAAEPRVGLPPENLALEVVPPLLSEIIHRVGHDIGNPLTAIISLASIVERFSDPMSPAQIAPLAAKLGGYGRSMSDEAWKVSLLNDRLVMLLSQREAAKGAVNLVDIAERVVRRVRARTPHSSVEIMSNAAVSDPVMVNTDAEQVTIAVSELLMNALQASADCSQGGAVCSPISLFVRPRDRQGVLLIRNDSPRAFPGELSEIFLPLVSAPVERKQLGLGLTVAAVILQRVGASIRVVEERDGERGTFLAELAFPLVA